MKYGENANSWLAKIGLSQNLEKISDLANAVYLRVGRFFHSRIIGNFVNVGYYDSSTGQFVVGGNFVDNYMKIIAGGWVIDQDTTSVANKTWTVPTGKIWKVHFAGMHNATRAYSPKLTIDGYDLSSDTAVATTRRFCVINGGGTYFPNTELIFPAGTTIKLTDDAFVAADNTNYIICYTERDE